LSIGTRLPGSRATGEPTKELAVEVERGRRRSVPSPVVPGARKQNAGEGQGGGKPQTSEGGVPPTPNPSPQGGGEYDRGCVAAHILLLILGMAALPIAAAQEPLTPFTVVGDAMPVSLTGAKGDPGRGRAIVANRYLGLCLLCHSGPFPEERMQGTLAPDLRGAGKRWSEGQLRLRIVDAARLNPATIMPPYHRVDGLSRVAASFGGKPVLTAGQIEDVVAFLATLRD